MTPTPTDVAKFRLTEADLRRRDGYAIWREVIGRTVLRLDVEALPGRRFHSEAETWTLPGVRISLAIQSGVRTGRTRSLLTDGNDDVAVHISHAGTSVASHRKREIELDGGEAAPMSIAEVCSIAWPSLTRATALQLSRQPLAAMVPNLDEKLKDPIPRDNEALRLLIGYIEVLTAGPAMSNVDLQRIAAAHVRDLVGVALGATRDAVALAEDGGIRAARLAAIMADIVARLGHRDLSVTAVAARHGISARYVQSLFEREGTTFSEFVLLQRLACAHRLLGDPRRIGHTISAIALEAGFGDLSRFYKAFRRQYGVAPSDVRAIALRKDG